MARHFSDYIRGYRLKRLFTSPALILLLASSGGIQAKELQYRMVDFGLHVPGVTEIEVRCLAKNIYFEAGIEDGKGKFAVALATLNRVRHKKFPNTVCGVVYQGPRMKNRPRACQFSWACDKKTDRATSRWLWMESRRIAALPSVFRSMTLPEAPPITMHIT